MTPSVELRASHCLSRLYTDQDAKKCLGEQLDDEMYEKDKMLDTFSECDTFVSLKVFLNQTGCYKATTFQVPVAFFFFPSIEPLVSLSLYVCSFQLSNHATDTHLHVY